MGQIVDLSWSSYQYTSFKKNNSGFVISVRLSVPREDNWKKVENTLMTSKNRFSCPVSLDKFYSWIKVIEISSNEESLPFPKVDNSEIVRIHCQHLKIFFRNTLPISTNYTTYHSWVQEIQVAINKNIPNKDIKIWLKLNHTT